MAPRIESFFRDVRWAARTLVTARSFTCIAALTLALGIGATTAIFSAVNSTLLRPLPFEDPAQLMKVSLLMPRSAGLNVDGARAEMIWSYPKYRLFRESQNVFENTSTYLREQFNLTDVDSPERLWGEVVGTSYFSVLGIDAELGRGFVPEGDATPGVDFEAVLSHGLWVRRFGSDPEIVGRTVHLNGTRHTVVGVLPSGFNGLRDMAEIWVPTSTLGERLGSSQSHSYHVVARLKDGFTHEQALVAMRALGGQIDEAFPAAEPWSATARPLDEYRVSNTMRTSVLLLFGAAGLVLLAACVNVAGLVLGRSVTRKREIATRLALGSSRLRLVRQLLTESLLLSVLGGVFGVAFAYAGVRFFNSLGAAIRFQMRGLERTAFSSIQIDAATLLFCVAVITVIPLLVGLLPAFGSSRLSLVDALKGGTSVGRLFRAKARGVLVITQVALAFTLLVGSGLLIRTMRRLNATDLGFQSATTMTVRVALPPGRYDRAGGRAFFAELLERVRVLPGVRAATFNNCVPFASRCRNTSSVFSRDGIDIEPSQDRVVGVNFVSPGYFDALGVPVLGGRVFTTFDRDETPRVVVISGVTARQFWPGEDAVGKSLSLRGFEGATVIGVVGDVRYDNIEEFPRPNVYVSTSQVARREGFIVARISTEPESYIAAIRQTVRAMDSSLPLFDIRTMENRVEDATWRTRFSTMLISLFASMTLVLSTIGIYGVLSYSVERKAHDIGVRMALGATHGNVLTGVVSGALLMATAGVALGTIVALAITRVLETLLYETSPHDPLTFGSVALVFIAVSLSASYFPARRASRVDPVEALKAE